MKKILLLSLLLIAPLSSFSQMVVPSYDFSELENYNKNNNISLENESDRYCDSTGCKKINKQIVNPNNNQNINTNSKSSQVQTQTLSCSDSGYPENYIGYVIKQRQYIENIGYSQWANISNNCVEKQENYNFVSGTFVITVKAIEHNITKNGTSWIYKVLDIQDENGKIIIPPTQQSTLLSWQDTKTAKWFCSNGQATFLEKIMDLESIQKTRWKCT